jgi:mRNA-degrading endonuclease RelE of RelBE toxin-antitoxin system
MRTWKVVTTKKISKKILKFNQKVQDSVAALIYEISECGPVRGNWPNFSKLEKNKYHCHIKRGKPTYVVCWEIIDKKVKLVEIYYVGTHEKAPY